MKANEFRIGNLVLDQFGRVAKIETVGFENTVRLTTDTYKCENVSLNGCNPINITPDWLSRFGAKKNVTQLCFKIGKKYGALIMMNGTCDFYDYKGRTIAIIKYVHQLQNLYFALTGEELKLLA